ncbi:MAG: hypothetical protein ACUVWJ_09715 [Spirochaetota bacterium]
MKPSGWLMHLTVRALTESMDVRSMIHLVRRLVPNYNLGERTGFSDDISMPDKDVAMQIVRDLTKKDLMLDFIILLIGVQESGLGGRKYNVPHLQEILGEVRKAGLIYDEDSRMFFEDPRIRRTRNWGVLRENEEYSFTFLKIDIAGNSTLVRENPADVIQATYSDLRSIVQVSSEKRNGRIWKWEGDGGLVAFYFASKELKAVLAAMEILHELHIYNIVRCRLNKPLRVRIAVHSGPCRYFHNSDSIGGDTIKKIMDLEENCTQPDSITISKPVFNMVHQAMSHFFEPVSYGANTSYYTYTLKWEK